MTNSNPIDVVAIEIEEMLNKAESPKKTEWCIYRVPHEIRQINKDAYTPKAVSIGPFHYGNERLQNMQTHKLVYFKKFIQRTNTNLKTLVSFIDNLEPNIRGCYAEDIKFDKHHFVKILLSDACFIIELFLRNHEKEWSKDDPLSPETRLSEVIQVDLLLFENQLPFIVLEKIFNEAFHSRVPNLPSFLELTFQYFSVYNNQELRSDNVNICHFTDLLRHFHLQQPSSRRPRRVAEAEVLHFSAKALHEAGLKFKVNDKSQCLLRLQFSGFALEIPQISVEDKTEVLFRNMVALEQCHYPNESYITDYVTIFDFLIDTRKDVDILVHSGVILNYLDDNHAVAKLFNGLTKNVIQADFNSDYLEICKKLKEFYGNPWQRLKATLRRDYCQTPWQSAASFAGIFLLFLTLLQTVCSVLPIIQPPKSG